MIFLKLKVLFVLSSGHLAPVASDNLPVVVTEQQMHRHARKIWK
jgi:hypothetical protein